MQRNSLEQIRAMLDSGLSPDQTRETLHSLLMSTAMIGDTTIGGFLIERGADLNRQDRHGYSALSLAAMTGHHSFVTLLLKSGASLEGKFYGMSLDTFLDWIEEYCVRPRERMIKIRAAFNAARNHDKVTLQ